MSDSLQGAYYAESACLDSSDTTESLCIRLWFSTTDPLCVVFS